MDFTNPYAAILPGARGRLLVTLVQLDAPVTVRALARHAGISAQAALDHVTELSAVGVVRTERAGAAKLVSLNREHLVTEPLIALVQLRRQLIARLRQELDDWPGLAGAWLFGSTARGEGGIDSDVDLLLVAETSTDDPDWAGNTARLCERVRAWTGNEAQLVEHTRSSLSDLVTSGNRLIAAVRRDGIALAGGGRTLLRSAA